ncbi:MULTISPECIES: pyridoxamine 5'-phosphate oxidase family protein [Sphingobacterium]|uniref:pyridoxamine 5'-phosphate oxidase family protein n=1 Tax=Sphingobacterium TaxID=28453 RepID=UPI0013DB8E67|nr:MULTISPECIES: pyridoxamine 5'-phosphate oxidase family protein [unclassified Sphingobacterium]
MSTEHISNPKEGIAKIKELAEGIDFCFFSSDLKSEFIDSTPMSVQEVDKRGYIWFLASKDSTKCNNIVKSSTVQLYFAAPKDFKFLTVYGNADLVHDQNRVDRYWNKVTEGWFEKGREDPNIILIRVKPVKSHYWDTKHHKLASYALTLLSAVSGTNNDQGIHGDIEIK